MNEYEARLAYDIIVEWIETHESEHEVLRDIAQKAADYLFVLWEALKNDT